MVDEVLSGNLDDFYIFSVKDILDYILMIILDNVIGIFIIIS